MRALVSLKELRLREGSAIPLQPDSIVVVVGPNNVGKSQILRDIRQLAVSRESGVIVEGLESDIEADPELVEAWASKNLRPSKDDRNTLSGPNGRIYSFGELRFDDWPSDARLVNSIVSQWIYLANCSGRLSIAAPAEAIDYAYRVPESPIHVLQQHWPSWRLLSGLTHQAFGYHIGIDFAAGQNVSLRLTTAPPPSDGEPLPYMEPSALRRWRSESPTLESQGDGVRSFVGCLLHALIMQWEVTLVDEPEAFLHPPQARLLGRMLVEQTPRDRQLVIATHSSDLLQGMLDAPDGRDRLSVVRLQREEASTTARVIERSAIEKLWSNPLFLFSNLTDGLFHDGVVICESDSDCRFYSALVGSPGDGAPRMPDLLWIWSGGKARIAEMMEVLRAAGVPARAIVDMDILQQESDITRLCSASGADYSVIAGRVKELRTAVERTALATSLSKMRDEVIDLLKKEQGLFLSEGTAEKIRSIVKYVSPWAVMKRAGERGLPQGDVTQGWHKIRDVLQAAGIFVVPVGELERFVPDVGLHGPRWVRAVFEKYALNAPELADARRFVERIVLSFARSAGGSGYPVPRPTERADRASRPVQSRFMRWKKLLPDNGLKRAGIVLLVAVLFVALTMLGVVVTFALTRQ